MLPLFVHTSSVLIRSEASPNSIPFIGKGEVVFKSRQTKFLILSCLESYKLEYIGFHVLILNL